MGGSLKKGVGNDFQDVLFVMRHNAVSVPRKMQHMWHEAKLDVVRT
jgi:hypothetical protein